MEIGTAQPLCSPSAPAIGYTLIRHVGLMLDELSTGYRKSDPHLVILSEAKNLGLGAGKMLRCAQHDTRIEYIIACTKQSGAGAVVG